MASVPRMFQSRDHVSRQASIVQRPGRGMRRRLFYRTASSFQDATLWHGMLAPRYTAERSPRAMRPL